MKKRIELACLPPWKRHQDRSPSASELCPPPALLCGGSVAARGRPAGTRPAQGTGWPTPRAGTVVWGWLGSGEGGGGAGVSSEGSHCPG